VKIKLFLLFFVLTPLCLFGQSDSLLYSYGIPTYSYHVMRLYGQDFLNYFKANFLEQHSKMENINVDLGLEEGYLYQTPTVTRRSYGYFQYDYSSTNNITSVLDNQGNFKDQNHYTIASVARLYVISANSFYINNYKGFSFYVDPGFDYTYDFKAKLNTHTISLPFGLGYGRVIGVRNVVQSYIIAKEIGADLSNETLLKIAEIIEKYDNDYYYATYKDDAEIEFYKDIANLTNKPEQALKIDQIINSPVYKTSERFVGWQIQLGVNLTYVDLESWQTHYSRINYTTATDLLVSATYALPIGFDKQLIASLAYSKNLNDEIYRTPKLKASARFAIDHNYHWATTLYANYDIAYLNEKTDPKKENKTNLTMGVKTDYTLLNSFSVYASLEYLNQEFQEYTLLQLSPTTVPISKWERIMFHLGFNWYIL